MLYSFPGKYLGKLLNAHAADIVDGNTEGVAPFMYTHLGSFAYVGKERAVLELPVVGSLMVILDTTCLFFILFGFFKTYFFKKRISIGW